MKSAKQGSAIGQYYLGHAYGYDGHGVVKDFIKAFEWYKKSAEQGFARGQHEVGCIFAMEEVLSQRIIIKPWNGIKKHLNKDMLRVPKQLVSCTDEVVVIVFQKMKKKHWNG